VLDGDSLALEVVERLEKKGKPKNRSETFGRER
jgi:hypothetical protein